MHHRKYRKVTKVIETVQSGTFVVLLGELPQEELDCLVENLWINPA
jgi:hypothetical protein